MPDYFDEPTAARGGTTDILGTLDDDIAVRFNGDAKIDLMRAARQAGFNSYAEFVRMVLYQRIYGKEHLQNLMLRRMNGEAVNAVPVSDIQGGAAHG